MRFVVRQTPSLHGVETVTTDVKPTPKLKFVSSRRAAELLGVSVRTLEQFGQDGQPFFPQPVCIKAANYWDPRALENFKRRSPLFTNDKPRQGRPRRAVPQEIDVELEVGE